MKRAGWLILAALCAPWVRADAEPQDPGRRAGPPVVPVEPTAAPTAGPARAAEGAPAETAAVTVHPGVNQILRVSAGHLNRIITPFRHPQVRTTTGDLTTEVSGPVIYVTGPPERPATLFVTEKGSEQVALSLTLVPDAVAPRQIRLEVVGADGRPLPASSVETEPEHSHPYAESIKRLLRELALGRIPAGYALAEGALPAPLCRQEGLGFEFLQRVEGRKFQVAVGRATNLSGAAVEFTDDACLHGPEVAAVAAWPSVLLGPGERTEVYVVLRELPAPAAAAARPSLLGGPPVHHESPPAAAARGGWGVQIAALSTEDSARQLVARLRADGFPAAFQAGRAGLHFVRVGPYPDQASAEQAADLMERLGYEGLVVLGGAADG